jgi:hypothetical protein
MPRYGRSVRLDAGDVRRIRGSLSQIDFARRVGVTCRTAQRWENAGAVLERWPTLASGYASSRLGKLDELAERVGLELVLPRRDRGENVVLRRRRDFTSLNREKRPRKTRQVARSGRGPRRRHGGERLLS